ncbi:MAG TPA: FAD:protein FMN transferase [Candidatus Saccharimonadales bacterium]|nr:FAD:protein FMN transferase [Candidatus Saccharimonadales bacterium]
MVTPLVFEALGGRCELFGPDPAALQATRAWIARMHDRLTRFGPDSELSRFNRSAGAWVAVSPELEALLRIAVDAYEQSGGLVHAGILPALLAAGYTRDLAAGPTPRTAERVLAPPLGEMLALRAGQARLAAGNAIDLGGLAKGWLADRAVERLGPNALANLAGDLCAVGPGPGAPDPGDGWPVGFGGTTVLLRDGGAATSGTTGRRWGDGLHHLIDPRTGAPAVTDLVEVSVLAATATEAEVLAKTALLLGATAGATFLDRRARGSFLR